jgi:hypothetical protein
MVTTKVNKKSDNPKTVAPDISDAIAELLALRSKHKKDIKAHRAAVRANVCEAYRIGRRLRNNGTLWQAFLRLDWGGIKAPPRSDQQKQAVRFAIKFMVGPGDAMDKKASFYYRAIKSLADEDAKPKEVEKALKMEGFKKLASRQASRGEDAHEADTEVKTLIENGPTTATKRAQQNVVASPERASSKSVQHEGYTRVVPTGPLGIKAELRFDRDALATFTGLKPMQGFKLKGVLTEIGGSVISVKSVKPLDSDTGSGK